MQNPSDPDATYDAHKGKGYQVQVQETYSEKDDENNNEKPRLITYIEVEQAHKSDANALLPAIDDTKERNIVPKVLLADSLYGGDGNVEQAKLDDVDVVSPTMGKESQIDIHLTDFEIVGNSIVIKCPEGRKPVNQTKKKTRNIVSFDVEHCSNCSRCSQCPVKKRKKILLP